ncbi:MAG: V-type ATP synthase subunit A [Thermoplasmata archaeon]
MNGEVYRVAGPVVTAIGLPAKMYDLVFVGNEHLMGEVIRIEGEKVVIQVYEDTAGVRPGEPVENTGNPLMIELGPGLLRQIYDGIQRPLPALSKKMGDFIKRGIMEPGLDRTAKWHFVPLVKPGDVVKPGSKIGYVQETKFNKTYILVPPEMQGKVKEIKECEATVEDVVCTLDSGVELKMMQKWAVRFPRPFSEKLMPDIPLITGQRIFDFLFPVAKGGTAAIPGPFGSGKTVSQHQLAKWSDADVVVYVGCGERGNEMTEVLEEFPELKDPRTGAPLMERTVLIANTSNMPVAAREASVYTGITIAEYFRDMGYAVALMADSTSRWAEAMREISSRLEEMPGEEGYPAYLSARLSAFYERAGRVRTLAGEEGSISVIGAVSPPGGDFSEPVTQNTLRIVKVFWALDAKLAARRHFPAINWLTSYSLYTSYLDDWFRKNVNEDWVELRHEAMAVLQKEAELEEIVQLVGSDSLPPSEQITLFTGRLIREIFLQQNAYHDVDSFCPLKNQYLLLKTILWVDAACRETLKKGVNVRRIVEIRSVEELARARFETEFEKAIENAKAAITKELEGLTKEVRR